MLFLIAGLMAAGFFVGALIGAMGATRMHPELLRKVFGAFLLLVSLHMVFSNHAK